MFMYRPTQRNEHAHKGYKHNAGRIKRASEICQHHLNKYIEKLRGKNNMSKLKGK